LIVDTTTLTNCELDACNERVQFYVNDLKGGGIPQHKWRDFNNTSIHFTYVPFALLWYLDLIPKNCLLSDYNFKPPATNTLNCIPKPQSTIEVEGKMLEELYRDIHAVNGHLKRFLDKVEIDIPLPYGHIASEYPMVRQSLGIVMYTNMDNVDYIKDVKPKDFSDGMWVNILNFCIGYNIPIVIGLDVIDTTNLSYCCLDNGRLLVIPIPRRGEVAASYNLLSTGVFVDLIYKLDLVTQQGVERRYSTTTTIKEEGEMKEHISTSGLNKMTISELEEYKSQVAAVLNEKIKTERDRLDSLLNFKINGYEPKPDKGAFKFGCAMIAYRHILDLDKVLTATYHQCKRVNTIKVKIGEGDFHETDISRLAEYIRTSDWYKTHGEEGEDK
jgi:hypothetical protein